MDTSKSKIFNLRPGDFVLLGLLAITCFMVVINLNRNPELIKHLLIHGGILLGFGLLMVLSLANNFKYISVVKTLASIFIIFSSYETLGLLGFELMPYSMDKTLSALDTTLFGGINPTLYLQRFVTPIRTELFSFIYMLFLAYVYISIILGCLGRSPREREEFLFGLTLVYSLGYLGYIFFPAHGPLAFHAQDYSVELKGYFLNNFMNNAVNSFGGAIGAFPSLHVGGSAFLCIFDLQRNRFRGMTYIPVAILVAMSTAYLRYHYIVDWIGGLVITFFALWVTPRVIDFWESKRVERIVAIRTDSPAGRIGVN